MCVHHELHEYDQDEDSSKTYVLRVLLSYDVFTFRKVLVAIERFGSLENRYLAVLVGGGDHHIVVYRSITWLSIIQSFLRYGLFITFEVIPFHS